MRLRKLTVQDVELIAFQLAKELMDGDEPLPDFQTRYPHKLESCLEQPFASFDGKDLYEDIYAKAAALFYFLNKNHPFANGNKRMAVMVMIVFLYINGLEFNVSNKTLYNIACDVASSKMSSRRSMLAYLTLIIQSNTRETSHKSF